MGMDLDNVELLRDGLRYKSQMKYAVRGKWMSLSFCVIGVLFVLIPGLEYMDAEILSLLGLPVFFFMGVLFPFFEIIKRMNEKKITNIEKNTVKFEKRKIAVEIISKTQETKTTVSSEGDINSVYNQYLIGVRTTNGESLTICSKELFVAAREGEYIDIINKRKLDKDNKVLDFLNIPLMNTLRTTL